MCEYKKLEGYSVAPYNFVALPKKAIIAYDTISDIPKHNDMRDDLLNGHIDYEIKTKTKTIVCDSKPSKGGNNSYGNSEVKEFYKNSEGKKVIPGSSIRGVIANNLAILSYSNISESIKDERFLYRSFGKGKNREEYVEALGIKTKTENKKNNKDKDKSNDEDEKKISFPSRIQAGFIYKKDKFEYSIIPAKTIGGCSYFRISEQALVNLKPKVNGIKFMHKKNLLKFLRSKDDFNRNKNEDEILKENKYKPYCIRISFNTSREQEKITHIGEPGKYHYEGYLMSSEYIAGKVAHYIIPMYSEEEAEILFNKENGKLKYIEYYKDDCLRTKKKHNPSCKSKGDKEYFLLPEKYKKENGKPLFYGSFDGMYCFGFSPYVRIPYLYSILDGVSNEYKNEKGISFLESIFGFANKDLEEGNNKSFKGRVSFQDVPLVKEGKESNTCSIVAGNPSASAYNLYLKQDIQASAKEILNYNSKGFEIRGIKEYWPRDFELSNITVKNKNLNINIKPVGEGAVFKGRINFKNLKKEELGLLLWSLKLDENAYETIGLGKPYGFGTVSLENIKVYKENLKLKYFSMVNEPEELINREEYIKTYKEYFKGKYSIDLDTSDPVIDLITIKTTLVHEKDKNEVRYMSIKPKADFNIYDKNEFSKLLPLPSAVEFRKILNGELNVKPKGNSEDKDSKDKFKNNKNQNKRNSYNRTQNNNRNNLNSNRSKNREYSKPYNKQNNRRVYEDKDSYEETNVAEAFRKAKF
ncbi:TIGR03986 family CRISPR-associated RAMP protein [Clostridium perfringens]|uniref:TIGR03986 family type III CRISPR-associated RAMP protein n=1 Tax=Clostridium perfringens TaxID=1502 RepID=UPI0013E2E1CC|nr:TIGR03986 family CRISPR-associated RAMP protein [Clostridium perfringens]NGU53290.1 TIGR03986 family CRISPR-associated RAMP protein [Clostridium perfringens]